MTITTENKRNTYSGNGSTTVFPYTFRIIDDDDLKVTVVTDSTGNITAQTKTTHYTVSGVGDSGGGNVTFVTAPASGETVIIVPDVSLTQSTDYVENDPFPANSHEDALDNLTTIAKDLQNQIDRCVKVPDNNKITDASVTDTDVLAHYIFKVNSAASGIELVKVQTAIEAITGLTTLTSLNDADTMLIFDNSDSDTLKDVSLATLKTYMEVGSSGTATQITYWNGSGELDSSANFTTDGTGVDITGDLDVDNINIDGNTISSTNTNGDVVIAPNGTGNIDLGTVTIDADATVGAGQDNYVLTYDHSSGTWGPEVAPGAGGGDAWSDPVDADIVPDADGTRDLGSSSNRFAELHIDSLEVNGSTTITGLTGTDASIVSGTAGTSGNLAQWDANGDAVDSSLATSNVMDLSSAQEHTSTKNFNMTTLTSTAASVAWNLQTNQVSKHTMTENTTLAAPTNQVAGATYILIVVQDSTTRTMSFHSAYKFPGGTAPTISTGSGAVDILTFVSDGTNMYGTFVQDLS